MYTTSMAICDTSGFIFTQWITSGLILLKHILRADPYNTGRPIFCGSTRILRVYLHLRVDP